MAKHRSQNGQTSRTKGAASTDKMVPVVDETRSLMVETSPSMRRANAPAPWQIRRAGPFRWVTGLPLFWLSLYRGGDDDANADVAAQRTLEETPAYSGIGRL